MDRYKVLMSQDLTALQKQVNQALDDGWDLAGGIAASGISYMQAVRKPKPREGE